LDFQDLQNREDFFEKKYLTGFSQSPIFGAEKTIKKILDKKADFAYI